MTILFFGFDRDLVKSNKLDASKRELLTLKGIGKYKIIFSLGSQMGYNLSFFLIPRSINWKAFEGLSCIFLTATRLGLLQ